MNFCTLQMTGHKKEPKANGVLSEVQTLNKNVRPDFNSPTIRVGLMIY